MFRHGHQMSNFVVGVGDGTTVVAKHTQVAHAAAFAWLEYSGVLALEAIVFSIPHFQVRFVVGSYGGEEVLRAVDFALKINHTMTIK